MVIFWYMEQILFDILRNLEIYTLQLEKEA